MLTCENKEADVFLRGGGNEAGDGEARGVRDNELLFRVCSKQSSADFRVTFDKWM